MKKISLILLIPFFLGISCQKETLPGNFIVGQEENFSWGNQYYSNDNNIELTITDINDSRCPTDVVCIWEGEAVVKIKVETQTINTIELSTYDNLKDTVDSYSIELLDVLPYPVSTETIDLEDYIVKLKIEKLGD